MFNWLFQFIEAWKIVRARSASIDQNIINSDNREALTEYRKLWPKTPYTCCDDSHEAGFIHGFNLSKEKYLGPHLKA